MQRWDALSVTLRYSLAGGGGHWQSPLLQGCPFITLEYSGATPVLGSKELIASPQEGQQTGVRCAARQPARWLARAAASAAGRQWQASAPCPGPGRCRARTRRAALTIRR